MNKEDVEYYGLMVYEAFILNQMLNNEPTMDKTKVVLYFCFEPLFF